MITVRFDTPSKRASLAIRVNRSGCNLSSMFWLPRFLIAKVVEAGGHSK